MNRYRKTKSTVPVLFLSYRKHHSSVKSDKLRSCAIRHYLDPPILAVFPLYNVAHCVVSCRSSFILCNEKEPHPHFLFLLHEEISAPIGPSIALERYFMSKPILSLSALLVAAAALFSGPVQAADTLSFSAARQYYHEHADIFKADASDVERARYAADSAKWLSGPKIDFTAMQIEGRKEINLDVPVPANVQALGPALHLPIPSSLNLGTNYDLSGPRAMLSINWPLYTGGLITAQQNLLEHKVREASAAQSARLETNDADFAARYWGVQLARSIEKLRRAMLHDEEEEVARARRFEAKGMLSKLERMSVEVSRDAAKRELVAAQTNTQVSETALMRALRVEKLPALSSPLFILQGDLGTLSQWQSRARANSPVLMQIDAKKSQAEEGVRAAQSALQPQIFAFGMKNLIKRDLTIVEPDWMVGIGIKFTLWDNRDRLSNIASSRAQVDQATAARAEADNTLAQTVETAFLRTTQAREEYTLTSSSLALATENLRLREASFAEGLSTALDLREARTQLVGAEIAQRAAAYKFVVSWAMLHAAAGVMPDFESSLQRPDLVNAQGKDVLPASFPTQRLPKKH